MLFIKKLYNTKNFLGGSPQNLKTGNWCKVSYWLPPLYCKKKKVSNILVRVPVEMHVFHISNIEQSEISTILMSDLTNFTNCMVPYLRFEEYFDMRL